MPQTMTEERCRSIFNLADIKVLNLWELPNGYWPRPYEGMSDADYLRYSRWRNESPWWLAKTPYGLIRVGWRKKVIEIDWSDTGASCDVTRDDVTKTGHLVHAWKLEDAITYLRELGRQLAGTKALLSPRV